MMIILIAGASHTGKTLLAQKLMEKHNIPYLSIDHLKMGLIRSGQTALTPMDDAALTEYLWPIVREMIKTAIENQQSLIVEGCYIPAVWEKDFIPEYLREIKFLCLVMTKNYIEHHFEAIAANANAIEARLCDDCDQERLFEDNERNLQWCTAHDYPYILIDDSYNVELDFL